MNTFNYKTSAVGDSILNDLRTHPPSACFHLILFVPLLLSLICKIEGSRTWNHSLLLFLAVILEHTDEEFGTQGVETGGCCVDPTGFVAPGDEDDINGDTRDDEDDTNAHFPGTDITGEGDEEGTDDEEEDR